MLDERTAKTGQQYRGGRGGHESKGISGKFVSVPRKHLVVKRILPDWPCFVAFGHLAATA
jgi:hypothetical protein